VRSSQYGRRNLQQERLPCFQKKKTKLEMKRTIFWDIMPCSPLKINQRLEGTYRIHLQDRKISKETKVKAGGNITRWFLAQIIFQP
jgi:hypothetical protein